ncbi:CASP-like protein 1D1 [Phalaenopsis equestris]|uniref:CASP-like protein 1D1 n=1 Tax=Phalaenopsis equestris TaxID=78828 RepID=UPI0009E56339|nr:CASP-like protein 1D1 [Phalaenopsis equestris]
MASPKGETDSVTSPSRPVVSTRRFIMDLILRILLFLKTLAAVIVMVTSEQKKEVLAHFFIVAKFHQSSAFVYFVVALSVACIYSLLMFGVVASAVGAAAAIGYVGEKGNAHVGWMEICNMFDKFCKQIEGSLILAISASVTLIFLIMLSTRSLYGRTR